LLFVPPTIAVAAIAFAASTATIVTILPAAIAITIAATTTLLSLHWHLCCAALSSFHGAGWLLPFVPLSLASLPHGPLLADCCVRCKLPWCAAEDNANHHHHLPSAIC
jgi:hypothetical protein